MMKFDCLSVVVGQEVIARGDDQVARALLCFGPCSANNLITMGSACGIQTGWLEGVNGRIVSSMQQYYICVYLWTIMKWRIEI